MAGKDAPSEVCSAHTPFEAQTSRGRTPSGTPSRRRLLPLDRAGRLAGDVEHDAVDLAQLADHARGDRLQQVVRQACPVGGHRVVAGDGADHDDVPVGALVALNADGADVGEHAERLPELAVEAGLADLILEDVVGLAQHVQALLRRFASHHADRETGPREGLAPDEAFGQSELGADRADLVLEERAQRLDQLELQVVGETADVVVGLDRRRAGAATGLDHVGVERALHEEPRRAPAAPAPLGELARPPPRRRG